MCVGEMIVLSDGETYSGTGGEACFIEYDENKCPIDIHDARDIPEEAIIRKISLSDLLDCWSKHNG
jgi:hypothetical protein